MTELKKPSAETIALMTEYHRQCISGEQAAGYWQWFCRDADSVCWGHAGTPSFDFDVDYQYAPAHPHPHYKLYKVWEAYEVSGAVERGEVEVLRKTEELDKDCEARWTHAPIPQWYVDSEYEIRKTDKYPDNRKPVLKRFDWGKVPVGTLTNMGEVLQVSSKTIIGLSGSDGGTCVTANNWPSLRILPSNKWTALQEGQLPPVCEELVMQYRYWDTWNEKYDVTGNYCFPYINAYRVIGIAPGYTDGGGV